MTTAAADTIAGADDLAAPDGRIGPKAAPDQPREAFYKTGSGFIIATLIRSPLNGTKSGVGGRAEDTPGAKRQRRDQCPEDSFSPTSPTTISAALATRATVSASPIITMPKMNAPTAPMPVQTA